MIGIYEYCGIQRCGKSTLMMADYITKLYPEYSANDTYANFTVNIDGVHCMENEQLIDTILQMKADKVRHKVIMFDEVGQELKARGYMDKTQTDLVTFCWQMPKMDIILMYCSNVGNSADIILRLATWQTIMPTYIKGETHQDDYIDAAVIFNYDCRIMTGIQVYNVWTVHSLFDSLQPII